MKKLFSYIKKLIDGETNDDVKDFGAMLFYGVLTIVVLASAVVFLYNKQYSNTLYLIGSIMAFISGLLGLKTYKEVKKINVKK